MASGVKGMGSRKSFVTRRRLLVSSLALIVAAPLGRIVLLRLKDNPLPRVAAPEPVLVGRWLLDASDIAGGANG